MVYPPVARCCDTKEMGVENHVRKTSTEIPFDRKLKFQYQFFLQGFLQKNIPSSCAAVVCGGL
jgi:hypothetical protein